MNTFFENGDVFAVLESRIKTILPENYQDSYEDVEPLPMRSAGLKYSADGAIAWNEIWTTFCDLAMAGGPPHKGRLLRPASPAEIGADPRRYRSVVTEICRGITMVTGLPSGQSVIPGWVRVQCSSEAMAGWLVRAILMENISVRCERRVLDLPAGPSYRLEKEIKNVITAVAKTCHYWFGHVPPSQQRDIGYLFAKMDIESPLIQPVLLGYCDLDRCKLLSDKIAKAIHEETGLNSSKYQYADWIGIECPDVHAAIWMMRAVVVSNVVSRREENMFFVPVNPAFDPKGETVLRTVRRVYDFALARAIL